MKNWTKLLTLVMAGAFVLSAGSAVAQDGSTAAEDTEVVSGDADETVFPEDEGSGESSELPSSAQVATCDGGAEGLTQVASTSSSVVDEQERDQTVDIDEDDVLLGIALANNGASDIDWNTLRDVTMTESRTHTESREADFEREDVFSALALGLTSDAGQLEALACVSDVTTTHTETTEMSREVDIEEDEVLLAIALANSVDSPLVFDDIADISESERTEASTERTVDIDREDTFLALALGAGGSA